MIHDTKTEHWIDWLEHADEHTIWTVHHFIASPTGDGAKTQIPNLKVKLPDSSAREAKENKDKAQALYDSFFFAPRPPTTLIPIMTTLPLALPSRTSLTHRFTEPSKASNHLKALVPTNNPTHSTYTAATSSHHTLARTTEPPST